jgi:hypothetical protein
VPDVLGNIALIAALASFSAACTSRARPGTSRKAFSDAGLAKTTFVCTGDRCQQRHPRFPDDGEWTCSDSGGAAVCSGGDRPAGVPFNLSDPTWICGARGKPGTEPADRERVCVDLAPDFPDGSARGWRCHYAAEEGGARVCDRDATAHVIGDACDARAPCLDGLRCVAGRCTPDPPAPSCILDGDCDDGVCRFGSCWRGPT